MSSLAVPPADAELFTAAELAYRQLRARVARLRGADDLNLLDRAHEFARERHGDQRRKLGDLYITHPIAVAEILVDQQMDMPCLVVALLHDLLEDTNTKAAEIRERFGEEVARAVEGVTKIGKLHFYSREDRQAESVRKMLLAMVSDIRVVIVKFADRLHNLRTLSVFDEEKRKRIAQETLDVYCPIAHRLGMGKVRAELEDLAFMYLEPEAFADLRETIQSSRNASEAFLEEIKKAVEDKLRAEHVPGRVEARLKRPYSVWQKMKRQKIGIHQVYDLLAVRVITDSVKNCYAALGVIHADWTPIPGRIKDFIAMPRPNLYQSLHTSVVVPGGQMFEVQIRTAEMHQIAEEGIAAHWKYKSGQPGGAPDDQRIAWLRQLVDWQKEMRNPADFYATVKMDLQPEEVFVFTPQGRVVMLPSESTPVDFAYAIHSDIGNMCTGARVNGRIVPLKYQLQNGEVVEILTQHGHRPSKDWLAFVKTSKARSKIKHFISESERASAISIGEKYLETEARRMGVILSRVARQRTEEVAREYGLAKIEDLHAQLGYGRFSPREVLKKLAPDQIPDETPVERPTGDPDAKPEAPALIVDGSSDMLTMLARCCNPVWGEPIVGYVTRGRGVSVHSAVCRNVQNLMFEAERQIRVRWGHAPVKPFQVKLNLRTDDRPGMLAQFTNILAVENVNIRSLEAHSERSGAEGSALVEMAVEVKDKKQLDRILHALSRVSGVSQVTRVS
ncbi:MAG: bifunctional (p)ppGpp synthetase/guanosine-3',5'-bis(diphosphate) 3'-pyrophosphohydrolase [Bryobacteraceae bacterium]|nr:bifunctional (p)ppGpp synthetase/guanosine-3',5'-bis(diphosphate) 3'-pyrophosphohydrolase [Bryobacteraceae bacterium]